jgi:hypothetical protein
MMDNAPGTLFERLVARTVEPVADVAFPLPPVFDTWGETADEFVVSASESSSVPTPEHIISPGFFDAEEAPPSREPPSRASHAREEDDGPRSREPLQPPAAPPLGARQSRSGENVAEPGVSGTRPPAARRDVRDAEWGRQTAAEPRTVVPHPADRDTSRSDVRPTFIWNAIVPQVDAEPRSIERTTSGEGNRSGDRSAAITTVLPVVHPNLPPLIREQSPVAAAMPVAPPEPIIHVTIGRLEIRSREEARPAKPAERAVVPSALEEYLAKRQGSSS